MSNSAMRARVDAILDTLPTAYGGPGGAAAVLRDGDVIARRTWGWANAERRIPFSSRSLFRICSITKQFTSALLLKAFPDPTALDNDVQTALPNLSETAPRAVDLCNNQSGLRDYWAMAMTDGALATDPFGDLEFRDALRRIQTLQFRPGTRYSYSNGNFRLLSEILERRLDRSFADLLRSEMFDPVGMTSAMLGADTRALPDGSEGYEGDAASGYRPAENRIIWTGDAGIAASLDDLIAWETYIDATRDTSEGVYQPLTRPVSFRDGTPAGYGYGLGRETVMNRDLFGHGGGLRGWSSFRLHVPMERTSVVVFFNHSGDARAAALQLLHAVIDEYPAPPVPNRATPSWVGVSIEPETGLAVRIDISGDDLRLRFNGHTERLDAGDDGSARTGGGSQLTMTDRGLEMDRPKEHLNTVLVPRAAGSLGDIAGRYRCEETGAELLLVYSGTATYGCFSGTLGRGRMELIEVIATDLLLLPCPRALDHFPPGDWTLDVHRDGTGGVTHVIVGCWLARGLRYVRVD